MDNTTSTGAGDPTAAAATVDHWTDEVDDLVDGGNIDGAVALLESVISRLETTNATSAEPGDLRLATALGDLAALHDSRGLSLKADELRARALAIRARGAASVQDEPWKSLGDTETNKENNALQEDKDLENTGISGASVDDAEDEQDDWEAMADSGVTAEALMPSSQQEDKVASCSSSEKENASQDTPKRRGRGSFLYNKKVLYSDQYDSEKALDDENSVPLSEADTEGPEHDDRVSRARLGTRHVLVLYDFSPTTRTIDLEKIFENQRDRACTIRWVNDTTALAVFRTPNDAHEAQNCVPSRYKVRLLKEDDDLLTTIDSRDLEPPIPRPRTSARTAQRLIAHGMGLRQFSNFSSSELKKQEEARKSRIVARQAMRDDAWGSDD